METPHSHLLVVDDDPGMRDLLRKVLEKNGHEISLASDSREALALLTIRPYDLILSDMCMPFDGGLTLLKVVRQAYPDTPVIIVTAFGDEESYTRAVTLGASAFIRKPLRMAELTAAVHTALTARGATASS